VPKVFALHEVVLPPGVTAEQYEQLFGEELASLPDLEGWKTYLLKGDRGDSAGKLLLMFEIESVEARDRYFPRPDPAGNLRSSASSRSNTQKQRRHRRSTPAF
jgi:hypothetical protein